MKTQRYDPDAPGACAQAAQQWLISGQVQGVGFRPFVYRLATELGLCGEVHNRGDGVVITAHGQASLLRRFERRLRTERPPLAVIDSIRSMRPEAIADTEGFHIADSEPVGEARRITPDTALCTACLQELRDPSDRRHRHAFITCTDCGPRYTITLAIPYDRVNTSMRRFPMCKRCDDEYHDASRRRFHAQPIACHACGPTVTLHTRGHKPRKGQSAIAGAAKLLVHGGVIAIKGIGAYHLSARADSQSAVCRIREIKARDAKPLAVMARDADTAALLANLSDAGREALCSAVAPIVLAPRKHAQNITDSVAPGTHRLGVMLPYSPIHHLIFDELAGCGALVMTSANHSDEPPIIDDAEALSLLDAGCDAVLSHRRAILRRVDDSVVLDRGDAGVVPLRRSRGLAPTPLRLRSGCPLPGLCVGGELKNTIALVDHEQVILSQHLGDLKHPDAFDVFKATVTDMLDLFGVKPAWIAHDMHPSYLSTTHAHVLARRWHVPLIGVQHHHAHAAALLAEHGERGPMLTVVCDGTGYGDDGGVWGGELLLSTLNRSRRLGHLLPLRLVGADAAARDPRRSAAALLYQAYGTDGSRHAQPLCIDQVEHNAWMKVMADGGPYIQSTAAGRYVDGYSALLGLCLRNRHEAEAPMMLEAEADRYQSSFSRELVRSLYRIDDACMSVIDLAPLTRWIVEQSGTAQAQGFVAALVHEVMAAAFTDAVERAAQAEGVRTAGLSGGVFCNQRLTQRLMHMLSRIGMKVLIHHQLPPNDAAISFGQAASTASRLRGKEVPDVPCSPRTHR